MVTRSITERTDYPDSIQKNRYAARGQTPAGLQEFVSQLVVETGVKAICYAFSKRSSFCTIDENTLESQAFGTAHGFSDASERPDLAAPARSR
jgi:hypothetical protein